jgi:hypothetical protein
MYLHIFATMDKKSYPSFTIKWKHKLKALVQKEFKKKIVKKDIL